MAKRARSPKKSAQPNLAAKLGELETAQLVRRLSEEEATYMFKHALTQDAAYQSLLLKQRREIHRHVAQAYEAEYGDQCLDDYAGILAQHYAEAGDAAQAFDYSGRAGDNAARVYANAEAILQYDRAIEIAQQTFSTDPQKIPSAKISELYLKRGRAFELSSQYTQALQSYDEMEQTARKQDNPAMELAALMARATLRSTPTPVSDSEQAQALLDHALELANNLGDRAAESKVLWNMMLLYKFSGRADQGVAFGERSLAIARELNLREQMAFTLNDLAIHGYTEIGQPRHGLDALNEASQLWQLLNNQPMLADTLSNRAVIEVTLGDYAQALDEANQARRISESIGNLWGQSYSRFVRGEVELEFGEIGNAIKTMEDCIQFANQAGFTAPLVWVRTHLAMAYADLGNVEKGIAIAQQAVDMAETQLTIWKAWAHATLGRLEVRHGNLQKANALLNPILADTGTKYLQRTWFYTAVSIGMLRAEIALASNDASHAVVILETLIAYLRNTEARHFIPETLMLEARLLVLDKQSDRAREVLNVARTVAETLGSKWRLWRILAALADIEVQRNNRDEAQVLREQAREIIASIAEHTPPGLRESFLNLRDVKSILAAE
jgi:tetratricopeptide (TPR) repeat protein